jgi:hypothetical protein
MRKREVFVSEKFYEGRMIPQVMYSKRNGIRKLYNDLLREGRASEQLTKDLTGIPIYKGDTEGDCIEALYVTIEGLVLYALIAPETNKIIRMHETPALETNENLLIEQSKDGMNKLAPIT